MVYKYVRNMCNGEEAGVRDKRERFVALAEARVGKALNAIRLIGNLSNRSNYEYSESDVNLIVRALEAEIKTLKARFAESAADKGRTFRLEK